MRFKKALARCFIDFVVVGKQESLLLGFIANDYREYGTKLRRVE